MRKLKISQSAHCSKCTKFAQQPRSYCEKHRKAIRRCQQKRKQRGFCWDCSTPALPGITKCEYHARLDHTRHAIAANRNPDGIKLTRWNLSAPKIIIKTLYQTNPYLRRDWDTAKSFILKHYDLWLPHIDSTWRHCIQWRDWDDLPQAWHHNPYEQAL